MGRRIIVTRTEPDAGKSAQRLKTLGFEAVACPALQIEFATNLKPPPANATFIFTSANGVRAALKNAWPTDAPAYCVGETTRRCAEDAGFAPVWSANGNVSDLTTLISLSLSPDEKTELYHIANRDAAGQLAELLIAEGYNANTITAYHSERVHWRSTNAIWSPQPSDIVLIYSARAAMSLARWIDEGNINTETLSVLAISKAAILPLSTYSFADAMTALRPNEDELIKMLQTIDKQSVL